MKAGRHASSAFPSWGDAYGQFLSLAGGISVMKQTGRRAAHRPPRRDPSLHAVQIRTRATLPRCHLSPPPASERPQLSLLEAFPRRRGRSVEDAAQATTARHTNGDCPARTFPLFGCASEISHSIRAARKLARGASLFPHAVGSSSLPFCRWVLCGATLRFHRGRRSTSWIAIQPCSSVQRMLELLSGCPRPLEIRLIEMETVSRRRPLWALSFKTIAPDPAPRAPGIRQIWASSFAFGRKCMQRPGLMSQTLRSQPRRLRAVSLVRPYGCPAKTRLSVWGATTRIMRRQVCRLLPYRWLTSSCQGPYSALRRAFPCGARRTSANSRIKTYNAVRCAQGSARRVSRSSKMFSRAVATFYFFLSLALLAVALPGGSPAHPTTTITATPPASTGSLCSTGSLQCCQSIGGADDPVIGVILGLLGVVVDTVGGLLGLQCSPIKIIGLGHDSACESNVVCCENNNVGGLISIGCIAIIL